MLRICILGLRLGRGGNDRVRGYRQRKRERDIRAATARGLLATYGTWDGPAPVRGTITITRVSPGHTCLDSDNAVASAKRVRDSIAAWLHIDDGNQAFDWIVRTRRGGWAVEIDVDVFR